jgi:hypothetical protein
LLYGLLFNPEDAGYKFLRNLYWLITDYTALYSKRFKSFKCIVHLVSHVGLSPFGPVHVQECHLNYSGLEGCCLNGT